ncbi:MAG: hypothetical protein ABEJ83_05235 [Candidatus Nanohaloarchaea archaeon]
MKKFQDYLEEGQVRKDTGSTAEADSLRKQAVKRFEQQIKKTELTEDNATFKFEDAYEATRQYLQSFLAEQGYKPYSHEAIIAYAKENSIITEKEANQLNQFRKLRNDIKYRAEQTNTEKTRQIIKITQKILEKE